MAANPVNAINYSDAIRDALTNLDLGFPAANAAADQHAQRYFQWKEAERVVKEGLDTTRDALLSELRAAAKHGPWVRVRHLSALHSGRQQWAALPAA